MTKFIRSYLFVMSCCALTLESQAFTLISTQETFNGVGRFLGPGKYKEDQLLFEMQMNNIAFTNSENFIVPFANNESKFPNTCGEIDFDENPDGKLSNGDVVNENINMCLATIAGTDMQIAAIKKPVFQGESRVIIDGGSHFIVTMDIAFDLGIGKKGVINMPFYGTTHRVQIPSSLQTQLGMPGGQDFAGQFPSGEWLEGRLGDFNNDGYIDGTLVSVGNIPLDSPVFPGQPYAMIRHFVMDVPASGYVMGNVSDILENNQNENQKIVGVIKTEGEKK